MTKLTHQFPTHWMPYFSSLFSQKFMQNLDVFLLNEYASKAIYPEFKNIFRAFDLTSFEDIKVVILGQDPYHGPGQAHGLSFSVSAGVKIPPSLKNIFKERFTDLKILIPQHGDLTNWAQQGVLLLNSVLTVEAHKAGSHQNKGWEDFTDYVIQTLSEQKEHLVFILWGTYAIKKKSFIDSSKHLVLENAHPSPLSAYRGFFGSQPFSKTNYYLRTKNKVPIDWST